MIKRLSISLAAVSLFASMSALAQDSCDSFECKLQAEYETCKYSHPEKLRYCFSMSYIDICGDKTGAEDSQCTDAATAVVKNMNQYLGEKSLKADWAMPEDKQDPSQNFVSIEKTGYSKETGTFNNFTMGCSGTNLFIAFETTHGMEADSVVYGSFDRTGARVLDWHPVEEDNKMIMVAGDEAYDIFLEIGLEDNFSMATKTKEGTYVTYFYANNYDDVSSNLEQCTEDY